MRFTPVSIFGAQVEFPVSGAIYRLEPTIFGDINPVGNGVEINGVGTTQFLTDPTASVFENNVIKNPAVQINNFSHSDNLGTIVWAWRCRPSGSNRTELGDGYLLDTRDGPGVPDKGIADGFINLNDPSVFSPRLDIGAHYQSGSFYNAYGNEDLQKFEINIDNIETLIQPAAVYNTGSQSFPGYYNNTITGSAGLIFADTGSNAYRFNAFSPNTVGIPAGSGTYNIQIFDNDTGGGKWYWKNGPNVLPPDDQDRNVDVPSTAAVTVFNRVLSDDEVRQVFNYYTSSLGLDIGL